MTYLLYIHLFIYYLNPTQGPNSQAAYIALSDITGRWQRVKQTDW